MATTEDKNKMEMLGEVVRAIEVGVKEVVSKKFDEAKKQFLADLEKDKETELAAITLHIMKMVDIQNFQDRIVITLRTEKKDASS